MEITLMHRLRLLHGMCQERTCTAKPAGRPTSIFLERVRAKGKRTRLPDRTRDAASIWSDTRSEVLKDASLNVGCVCLAFFRSQDENLQALCHGGEFCVVARRKQLQISANVLEKRFEVKQTGHIGFSADAKDLKIFHQTSMIDSKIAG